MLTSEAKARFLDAVGENFRIISTLKLHGDFFFVAYDHKQPSPPCEDDLNLYKLECNGDVSIVTPRAEAERMLGICEIATLTYEEAKAELLAHYDETFRDEEGYTGMRVLSAWELPESFLFVLVEQGEKEPYFGAYRSQIHKDGALGRFCAGSSIEDITKFDDLLTNARRIL